MLTLRPFSAIIVKDQLKALKCAKNYLIQEFYPEQRRVVIKTLDTKKELRLLDDDVITTCRNVHRVLTDDEENDDDMNDRLDQIKLSSTNKDSKALLRLHLHLLTDITQAYLPSSPTPHPSQQPNNRESIINNEFRIVFRGGKKTRNADSLNKLVLQKVDNPVVVGLLIEGTKASTFKMDIAYNGQYRMVELSQFHLLHNHGKKCSKFKQS
ncbi:hypothetical protein [Parasitella parasitica]|uniref:Uncharacterized protein n=1 Tax=Parasitella parasitica TaxID=35722 RepID=A0A0B7NEN4_9FUNG|nr:hypothetical protein [Parasitella parasitica]